MDTTRENLFIWKKVKGVIKNKTYETFLKEIGYNSVLNSPESLKDQDHFKIRFAIKSVNLNDYSESNNLNNKQFHKMN